MMTTPPNDETHCTFIHVVLAGAATLLFATSAGAGIHTWDVVEVFSDASGTIQYVELLDRGTGGNETGVGNGSLSSGLHSFSWSNGPVGTPTNGRSYLVATSAFAALPGAPVPDVIIPSANVPFFNTAGDTVAFGMIDSLTFGVVPTNGTDSLTEAAAGGTITAGPNTPKNYAGTEGSVNAAPPGVPSSSVPTILLTLMIMTAIGFMALRRRGIVDWD